MAKMASRVRVEGLDRSVALLKRIGFSQRVISFYTKAARQGSILPHELIVKAAESVARTLDRRSRPTRTN